MQDTEINTGRIICNNTSKAMEKNIYNEFAHTYHHKTLQKYVKYKHRVEIKWQKNYLGRLTDDL